MAKVAVLFGGVSNEHGVSCVSGAAVMRALADAGHEVVGVGITPRGTWHEVLAIPEFSLNAGLPTFDAAGAELTLSLDPARRGFHRANGSFLGVDVVFPVLHGPYGEDGSLQGALELAQCPYVGSGVLASAVAMDKITMKHVLSAYGLPVVAWAVVPPEGNGDAEAATLGYPLFVKPARAGSSRGISRVDRPEDLAAALAAARDIDPRVLMEKAVIGAREIECGVLQDPDGHIRASRCAEIVVHPDFAFYDFDAKYVADGADLIVPAQIDNEERIRQMACAAFDALGAEGLARVDFFVAADGNIMINEVNTMPGFTSISMYPRMWAASGISYQELVDALVLSAMSRPIGLR